MPTYDYNDYNNDNNEENEISRRSAWEIASWVIMAGTILLNLIVILILLVRENAYSVVNKGKKTCEKCENIFDISRQKSLLSVTHPVTLNVLARFLE